MQLTVTNQSVVRDEGSIIILEGEDYLGNKRTFACDRRPALDIIAALQSGAEDEITVEPEDWAIIGGIIIADPPTTPDA